MKYLLVALVLIPSVAFGQITCEVDEFKGTTECSSEVVRMDAGNRSMYGANVLIASNMEYNFIFLTFASDTWQYMKADKVYFLIDGEREVFELIDVDRQVREDGNVIEQYAVRLTSDELMVFDAAEVIRFKIGSDEYDMPDMPYKELLEEVGN